ncbi:uncharacterized protein MKK02DRAFT_39936 [Dioszegia hungarica]|uniref:Uncharacterized protein n=1 Tax=Dioszegia hungarica TaxID=4972 RepID=A0AA38LZ20_9TREE|nr:uncharacterized protein MKK02DRAFT_39936 [Dioszegia hungarica]KAI9639614.1 hypothetical protein MKK02DRAFT_39936 [Dioszegia hungarica]
MLTPSTGPNTGASSHVSQPGAAGGIWRPPPHGDAAVPSAEQNSRESLLAPGGPAHGATSATTVKGSSSKVVPGKKPAQPVIIPAPPYNPDTYLDISPRLPISWLISRTKKDYNTFGISSDFFMSSHLDAAVEKGLKRNAKLQTLDYLSPLPSSDHPYIIHLRKGKQWIVEYESQYKIDVGRPPPLPGKPYKDLPAAPRPVRGRTSRHTIAVRLASYSEMSQTDWPRWKEHRAGWKAWLLDPRAVRRIVGVDLHSAFEEPDVTLDETLAWLAARRRLECEPITSVYLPCPGNVTLDRAQAIISSLPLELRSLWIAESILTPFSTTQLAFDARGRTLPRLRDLVVFSPASERSMYTSPISGLPTLRTFSFHHNRKAPPEAALESAHLFAGIATRQCVYQDMDIRYDKDCKPFDDAVRRAKG